MKYIWIITITICTIYQVKCPFGCIEKHDHYSKDCKDSLVSFRYKAQALEFYKANAQSVKRVDSLTIN